MAAHVSVTATLSQSPSPSRFAIIATLEPGLEACGRVNQPRELSWTSGAAVVDTIKDVTQRWNSGAGASPISASPLVALASWVAITIIEE